MEENILERDLKRATECLIDDLIKQLSVPLQKGQSVGRRYILSDKKHIVTLAVESSTNSGPTVRVAANLSDSDRVYNNYLFEAGDTQEKIVAWLKNKETSKKIIYQCWSNLTARCDE